MAKSEKSPWRIKYAQVTFYEFINNQPMGQSKKTSLLLAVGAIVFVLIVLGWFIFDVFEGEKAAITLQPTPEFISEAKNFTLEISDNKRGLKTLEVSLSQEGHEINILKESFPFKGFFNSKGTHRYYTEFSIDPAKLNLAQGRVDLDVRVWDHSRRRGGDGNISMIQHKMIVDTIPPAIRAVSRSHHINVGGTGLVVYQTSSDSINSGVYVSNQFFNGFPIGEEPQDGYHVCYFAISTDIKSNPEVYLWTQDKAGNCSKANFYFHIRRRHFRTEKVKISDRFLKRILPYFSFYTFSPDDSDIVKFLKINKELRKENASAFYSLRTKTTPKQLWEGKWLRLKNAANMASFGDRRIYYYKGEKIDKQVHVGVDLASLANSQVEAANNGQVIFADRLGIYGNTVVLDHGQGLASVYAHLSQIGVESGQQVIKGDIIGLTGQTGLAGGDHLHFGVTVSGEFVNLIEWWDPHWIQDNVTRKLALLKK